MKPTHTTQGRNWRTVGTVWPYFKRWFPKESWDPIHINFFFPCTIFLQFVHFGLGRWVELGKILTVENSAIGIFGRTRAEGGGKGTRQWPSLCTSVLCKVGGLGIYEGLTLAFATSPLPEKICQRKKKEV